MKRLVQSLLLIALTAILANPVTAQPTSKLDEVSRAGNAAIAAGDWPRAESFFRHAVKLAPKQGLWRIQLVLSLGQQRKWKSAFEEMEPLAPYGALDWIVTANRNLTEGKVAFIDSAKFRREGDGITRFVAALNEKTDVDSVTRDIGVKLDAFADENKLALIYDISKFKTLPFEKGNTLDVTNQFIAYYNRSEYTQKYFGTVYLYRGVDTQNYGTQIIILNPEAVLFLDGKEFLRMPEKTFIGFKVPVGTHALQMAWQGGSTHLVTVEPNGTYYLRVTQLAYPNPFQTINRYDEQTALKSIRESYLLPQSKIKLQRFEQIRANPNDKQ